MDVLLLYLYVCLMTKEARKECQMIPPRTGVTVLEMEHGSSARTARALNHPAVDNKIAQCVAQSCVPVQAAVSLWQTSFVTEVASENWGLGLASCIELNRVT